MQVQLQRRADGSMVLQLSSPRPINDPFVDLVIDANWSAGHIVRSYTLLLDPPALRRPPPASVAAAAQTQTPPAAAAPEKPQRAHARQLLQRCPPPPRQQRHAQQAMRLPTQSPCVPATPPGVWRPATGLAASHSTRCWWP